MIKNAGKIIVFEGGDCSFKETNSKSLCKYLNDNGIKTTLISFPTYDDDSSIFIRRYLSGEYGDMSVKERMMIYALNRMDIFKRYKIKERLADGEWFIFDRYIYSNMIYLTAGLSLFDARCIIGEINKLEFEDLDLPSADLLFVMHCSNYEEYIEKLKGKENKDRNEQNYDYMCKVHHTITNFLKDDWLLTATDIGYMKKIETYDYETEGLRTPELIFEDIISCTKAQLF